MLSDPITCKKCGREETKEDWLERCPDCGSDELQFPEPSEGELILQLTKFIGHPIDDPDQPGNQTRDAKGVIILPGDNVKLYGRILAKVYRIILPQGWLIVRLLNEEMPGHGVFIVEEEQYRISSALVFNLEIRKEVQVKRLPGGVEIPIEIQRVNWFRRSFAALVQRWRGL